MEVEVEIQLMCSDCGSELEAKQLNNGDIEIEICQYCIDKIKKDEWSNGYDEGYTVGKNDE